MGDRLLRYMADQAQPVRLYSPNPDAPQWSGLPATEEPRAPFSSRLWNAVKNAPGQLWGMLPPEARNAYTSGAQALVDMSTPASVRDYTNSAQDTARSAMQGDGWGTATNALATVNAALGAIPVAGLGVRAASQGAKDVAKVANQATGEYFFGVKAFTPEEVGRIVPAVRVDLPDGTQKIYRTTRGKTHEDVVYKMPDRHFRDNHVMDDGFFDPVSGQYFTRDDMSARMAPSEANALADRQRALKER